VNAHDDGDQMVADYLQRLGIAASALPADRRAELIEEITAHIAEARAAGPVLPGGPLPVRNILERLGEPADIVRAAAGDPASSYPAGAASSYPAGAAWSYPAGAASSYPAGAAVAEGAADRGHNSAGRAGALEICAVIFLLIGGLVLPVIGWVIGVVLLWASPRWRTADKLLGTLVWPGGLLAPAALLLFGGLATVTAAPACGGSDPIESSAPAPVQSGTGLGDVHQAAHQLAATTSCTTAAGPPTWLIISIAVVLMAAAICGPILVAIRLLRRAARPPAQPAADPSLLQTV
jgi:hypothetical protein